MKHAKDEPVPDGLQDTVNEAVAREMGQQRPVAGAKVLLRRQPILVAATIALLVGCAVFGITLLPTNTGRGGAPSLPSAVAETIEGATAAMAEVQQAHLVGQNTWGPETYSLAQVEPVPREAWYSAEYGVREDSFYGPREVVQTTTWIDKRTGRLATSEETVMRDPYTHSYIVTPDMFFTYTDTTDRLHLTRLWPGQYEMAVEGVLRSGCVRHISDPQSHGAIKSVTVTDDILNGAATKRIDWEGVWLAERAPDGGDIPAYTKREKIWFEADTLRVLRWEILTIEGDDEFLSWAEVDYDTPVDASLFEVPAGVEVIDTRLTPERGEVLE